MTDPAPSTPKPRRRWQFSLRTLLLLPVLVAMLIVVGPRVVEEFDPIESGLLVAEFQNSQWSTEGQRRGEFQTEMIFISEDPFRLSFLAQNPA